MSGRSGEGMEKPGLPSGIRPRVWCYGGVAERDVAAALEAHHAALAAASGRVVQSRPWRRVTRVPCGPADAAVKEFRHNPLRRILSGVGLPSRARSAAGAHRLLATRGFSAAALLAVVEEGRAGSYLLTRWVADGVSMRDLFRATPERDAAGLAPGWRSLVRETARHLARLHGSGLTMDDYHTPNLVMVGWPGSPELVLVDFDSVWAGRIPGPQRLLNLYTFRRSLGKCLSAEGREFLVRAYLEALAPDAALSEERIALLSEFAAPFLVGRPLRRHLRAFWRRHAAALRGW